MQSSPPGRDPFPPEGEQSAPKAPPPSNEPVWTYRGYRIRSSEFVTAMAHLFRGEIQRANVWRQRLDTTTNWAVISAAAAITVAFTENGHHGVILLNTLLIALFLSVEARRYRYYELWSSRVRLLETDFYAAMLVPPFQPAADWAESLADTLLHPQFPISTWEAVGRRYRRNYMWIFAILAMAWLAKTLLFPTAVSSWSEFITRAAIGGLPAEVVLTVGAVFNGALLLLGIATIGLHQGSGEVLPRFDADVRSASRRGGLAQGVAGRRPWYRTTRRRGQLLGLIVTGTPDKISRRVLHEMQRGVTGLSGMGMYTGTPRTVLICAMTVTEINHLKQIVAAEDASAFVMVTPAEEILGRGFLPLHDEAR